MTTWLLIILIVLLLKNYPKYLGLILLLGTLLSCFVSFEPLNLYTVVGCFAVLILVVKYRWLIGDFTNNKFFIGLLFYFVSIVLTNTFSGEFRPSTLINGFVTVVLILTLYSCIQKYPQRMLPAMCSFLYYFGWLLSLYGIYVALTGSNPYIEMVQANGWYGDNLKIITDIRYNVTRTQSFFSMHTTSGCVCACYGLAVLYLYRYSTLFIKYKYVTALVLFLLLAGIFSGSRSVIIFIVVSLCFVLNKKIFDKRIIIAVLLSVVVLNIIGYDSSEIINSIINSDSSKVQGSSASLRDQQLAIIMNSISDTWLIGNGVGYTWTVLTQNVEGLFGAESLWFQVIGDQGLVGVIAYLGFFISCMSHIIEMHQKKVLFFLAGFVICCSLTSLPQFDALYIAVFVIIMTGGAKFFCNRI